MYKNKKDVDKYVENLLSKHSAKDVSSLPKGYAVLHWRIVVVILKFFCFFFLFQFKTRAYSIARLYFDVGDYTSCQKYVEQYLSQKENNAAAYKLLGQALQKLGQKDKALEQFKTSLEIDPTQTSTILDSKYLLQLNWLIKWHDEYNAIQRRLSRDYLQWTNQKLGYDFGDNSGTASVWGHHYCTYLFICRNFKY